MDRFCASPETVEAVTRHLRKDGLPDEAAGHLAAEMVSHPADEIDSDIGRFQEYYHNYKSKGFANEAAQHLAVEALETKQPPSESMRYRRVYGG